MRSLINFLKYNNALPIALFLIFGMGSAAFAASPAVREQVIKSEEVVRSVDNTYVVETDFENFDYKLLVTAVTEDDDFYHVSYTYTTISIVDYVWQPVTVNEVLKVGKLEIQGKDLGLYVAKQLGEVLAGQKQLLLGTQVAERRIGATPKVVATEYSGLIGKFLDPTEKTFEGYEPIIEEKPLGDRVAGAAAAFTTGGPAGSTAAAPVLTPQQVEQMIQDKVNAILAAGTQPPPTAGTSTPPESDDEDDTPSQETPPAETPPATTTPPVETPPAETPPVETPPVETPPAETPPAETPPAESPPAETPAP